MLALPVQVSGAKKHDDESRGFLVFELDGTYRGVVRGGTRELSRVVAARNQTIMQTTIYVVLSRDEFDRFFDEGPEL